MENRLIPTTMEEITAEWLTGALTTSGVLKNNSVRTLNRKIIGVGQGYMGTLARLSIEYEKPDDTLPSTMIAKIPTKEAKNKMLMEAFWNYEREIRLYEEIVDQVPIRTPHCYFSDFDPGPGEKRMTTVYGNYGKLPQGFMAVYFIYVGVRNLMLKRRYILLFEDFSNLEQISHKDGCSYEDVKMAMKPLGIAHAALWESPLLNKYWLKDHADFSNMLGFISSRWQPVIKKWFPEKVSEKGKEVFNWLKNNNKKLDDYTKTRPHTLIHTDFRLDNIFFDREKNEIALVDWQATCPGMGLFDPAFFILNNCSNPITPKQAEELIAIYHQGLVEGGVSNYSLDECMSDYPYGLLLAIRYWLIILGGVEVEKDPNAKELFDRLLDRMKPMIEAIDLPML